MPRSKDFTNEKYGHLTALYPTGRIVKRKYAIWVFRCDCGKTVERVASLVVQSHREGNKPVCAMNCPMRSPFHKAYSEGFAGKRFGKLIAIEPTGELDRRGFPVWSFRCHCGDLVKKSAHNVFYDDKGGHIASCGKNGCIHKYHLERGRASRNQVVTGYRSAAKARGLEFKLTDEVLDVLFQGNCHYCGQPPSNVSRAKENFHGEFLYNGIDRIDSTKGYIQGNVVPCCSRCNRAKSDTGYEEFIQWIKNLVSYRTSIELTAE